MKQLSLLAILAAFSIASFGQAKPSGKRQDGMGLRFPPYLTITVDSAEAVKFLTILQVGTQSLMQTQIPANQVADMQRYGDSLFRANVAIFNS